jgi:hypothetical protein
MPFEVGKAGGVAAWARQAFDVAGANWVGDDGEHDWDGARHLQQRCESGAGMGQDDVRGERNQFRGMLAHGVGITAAPPVIDQDVLSDGPTQLLETLRKGRQPGL